MRRRLGLFLCLGSLTALLVLPKAGAENPAWPPSPGVTPTQLMDPATWPDDPGYGYDVEGDGMSCIDDSGGRCWTQPSGGDWNYWSWVPPSALEIEGFRADEATIGSGTWTDMAWQHTVGDKRVVIAVLDSGIKWDERDLVNQYHINRVELEAVGLDPRCLPQPAAGHTGDPIDVDGDGFLTMRDYTYGQTTEEAARLSGEIDGGGNRNGLADPGDLITLCTDGIDDDGNGYADDISGWDFYADDNDPQDDNRYGHGTGEARWSAAEGNDGQGDIGQCPGCRVLLVRVGDSFIADSQDYAQGVIFAVDSGASVVQEALGTINNTTFMRRANDYAYDQGVLLVASAADENSRHHNMPGTSNHTLYVHAIQFADEANAQNATSFLSFNNCTNYGAQLVLSAPGTGCSSEATGVTAGIAGLLYSASLDTDGAGTPLDPPLRAEEARQLLMRNAFDIFVPESDPAHPLHNRNYYPSVEGWDQRFGYGRINAYEAVLALREGRIPPEVDLVHPDWFRVLYPDEMPIVTLRGRIAADRAGSFDYLVEWAPGIEPVDADFETLAMGAGETAAVEGALATWDISGLTIDNPGEAENRHTVTVRIRATAHYGGTIGDVAGETRRAYAIHRDPDLLPGFPLALGVRNDADPYPAASGEGSAKLVDVDGDDKLEIIYADTDGLLHAINEDATEVPGYPIQLGILRGYDAARPDNVLGSAAYASGAVPTDDLASSVVLGVPAIGDLDGDGSLEIVVPTIEGDVYAFHASDGTPVDGFPVGLPEVPSGDPLRMGPMSPDSNIERGIIPAPTLADLDSDGNLEIVIVASDGHIYVLRHDGTQQPGFPVAIRAPVLWDPPAENAARLVTPAAVGDGDGDGIPDIAVGSNETGSDNQTGAVHLIHGDGNLHEGGPSHANWPIVTRSINFYPFIGEGVVSPLAMADVNDDGRPDISVTGTANYIQIFDAIQPERMTGFDPEAIVTMDPTRRGALHTIRDPNDLPLFPVFAGGIFGDMDQDGRPEFLTGGGAINLALNLAGGHLNKPFDHQVGAWSVIDGRMITGFPQRIEDYLFFVNPTVADIDGDRYPEALVGSGGYYLHAWNGCGDEPAGWPKFTGSWITSSAAVGDIDGDGLLEVVITTRLGYLFAWNTTAPADGTLPWPEFRHDNRNTGNYETPLSNGGFPTLATEPLTCVIPSRDGGAADGGVGGHGGGGGCDCRITPGGPGPTGVPVSIAALALLLALRVRRRR